MTHNVSSCRGSHHDFTPRIAFVGPVRGLSIQRPCKHERQVPARQRFEQGGKAQDFGRVFVHGSVAGGYADALYVVCAPTCNATCNRGFLHQIC
jgi:hypothetical protein